MGEFAKDHPFITTLGKIIAVIIVSMTTISLCIIGSFIFLIVLLVGVSGDTSTEKYSYVYGNQGSNNKLLSIPVNGVIMGEKNENAPGDFFGLEDVTYGYDVKKQLVLAKNDKKIKGIILEVDSPGGTIYGSRAIADGIEAYREATGKPVIAHVGGMAASGAYWVVSSADNILADYGTLVGSIGVIFGPFKYYDEVISEDNGIFGGGVTTENGIDSFYFTAGKYKDFGNPYRRLTPDETRNAQQLVDNEYNQFVNFVSIMRRIPPQTIRDTIGALVYDNQNAERLGLIDGTGSKEEAYMFLADAAQLKKGSFQVIRENTIRSGLESFLSSRFFPKETTSAKTLNLCATHSLLSYYGDLNILCQ